MFSAERAEITGSQKWATIGIPMGSEGNWGALSWGVHANESIMMGYAKQYATRGASGRSFWAFD